MLSLAFAAGAEGVDDAGGAVEEDAPPEGPALGKSDDDLWSSSADGSPLVALEANLFRRFDVPLLAAATAKDGYSLVSGLWPASEAEAAAEADGGDDLAAEA